MELGGSLEGAERERWAYKRDLASRALTLTNHLMKKNEAVQGTFWKDLIGTTGTQGS